MDTQSYGLFISFLLFLNSVSRSDELLFMLFLFTIFPFFYSAFQKKDSFMGDLYYHQ